MSCNPPPRLVCLLAPPPHALCFQALLLSLGEPTQVREHPSGRQPPSPLSGMLRDARPSLQPPYCRTLGSLARSFIYPTLRFPNPSCARPFVCAGRATARRYAGRLRPLRRLRAAAGEGPCLSNSYSISSIQLHSCWCWRGWMLVAGGPGLLTCAACHACLPQPGDDEGRQGRKAKRGGRDAAASTALVG